MIRFIDEHRDQFGVEAICRVLRTAARGFITSRGYRAAKRRLPSVRHLRDEVLVPEVARLHTENYGVYGRRKMHALLRRQGWEVGRDQTERLMRLAGVRGVKKWNNSRLHGELDMRTPIEVENAYYADQESGQPAPAGQGSR